MSTYNAAILEDDLDKHNGHVTGQVDIGGHGQELGYLNIRWSYPTDGQAGVYGCSVVGITAFGHSVTLTHTLEVKKSSISLADLIMEIRDLKKSNTELQSKMAANEQKIDLQQSTIIDLQSKVAQQQNPVVQNTTTGDCQSTLIAEQQRNDFQQSKIEELQSNMTAQQQLNDLQQTAIGECQSKMAAQQTTIGDLQSKMAVQQQNITSQHNMIGDLQSNISTQQHDIDSQHTDIIAQQTTIGDLQSKMTTQETTIGDLQSKMAATQSSLSQQQAVMQSVTSNNNNMTSLLSDLEVRLTHVETGAVYFDHPSEWRSSHIYMYSKPGYSVSHMLYKDIHISFNTPYTRPPAVTWAVGVMHHTQDYLMYSVEVRDVTTTGCVIRAGVLDGGSNFWFTSLVVEWTSIPR